MAFVNSGKVTAAISGGVAVDYSIYNTAGFDNKDSNYTVGTVPANKIWIVIDFKLANGSVTNIWVRDGGTTSYQITSGAVRNIVLVEGWNIWLNSPTNASGWMTYIEVDV